ncbi:MAG: hypothetical protein AAGK70_10075 [Pseudomonadota bacterium]
MFNNFGIFFAFLFSLTAKKIRFFRFCPISALNQIDTFNGQLMNGAHVSAIGRGKRGNEKMKTRWIKSVVEKSEEPVPNMPFDRSARFIAKCETNSSAAKRLA